MRDGIRRETRRAVLTVVTTLLLSACGVSKLIGPPDAPEIYVLRPALSDLSGPRVSWALAVNKPSAPSNLDTDRIAISRSANRSEEHTSELQSHVNLVC